MKNLLCTVVCFCLMAGAFAQSNLTSVQKRFQNEIIAFIKEEGFSPSINSNSVIIFKKEGKTHAISIHKESPFFVFFERSGYLLGGDKGFKKTFALLACNGVNRELEAVKLYCTDENVIITIEQYIRSAEDFKYVFDKSLEKLNEGEKKFLETYDNINTDVVQDQPKNVAGGNPNLQQFFPIYGITLGKTTTNDMKKLGYAPKLYENGPSHVCHVETLSFWDMDGDNIYEQIYTNHSAKMPAVWTDKFGFKWELSYNYWMSLFKRLNFSVTIKKAPETSSYQSRNVLTAEFEAISADKSLKFVLKFNYGNGKGEGYGTDAKNSLYSISVYAMK